MELEQITNDRAGAARYLGGALDGLYAGEPAPTNAFVGGRTEGLKRLRVFNSAVYQARRNDVGAGSGASQLSPYLRHGCLGLGEAKAHAVEQIGVDRAFKWIQELAWRQFWQLQWARLGNGIFANVEEPKVPLGNSDDLPDDIAQAETGLRCIDHSLEQLHTTGYVHNHARMWLAAYLVHWRKLSWKAGATLFYRYLLDGDPASNSLSWQWVASTFSHKPYIFNRGNVEKYSRDAETGETHCAICPAARNNTCPFDASYETLGKRLFGKDYDADNGYQRRSSSNGDKRGVATRRPSFRR